MNRQYFREKENINLVKIIGIFKIPIILSTLMLFIITLFPFVAEAQTECVGTQGQVRFFYWNNITGNNMNNLLNHPNYPTTPDGMIYLNELQSSSRFNDYYGARVRGFISPTETGNHTFNIIGNENVKVYLSTDETVANLDSICATLTHADMGHDQYESQTSAEIFLEVGLYYFFEILLKEQSGADHIRLYWKTPSQQEEWRIVEGANIYDYACDMICQPYGTSCDDNDPTTINDIEDGHCNCYGQIPIGTDCIGERGNLRVWYYDDIPGWQLTDLENHPSFPNSPSSGDNLPNSFFNPPLHAEYGALLKAFVRIPETGDYVFEFIGDNESRLLFSANESTDSEDVLFEIHHPGNNQNILYSDVIALQEGQYHYIQIMNKGNGNGDEVRLKWQRPNTDEFEYIDADYFYNYQDSCDDICAPDGITCNDFNDATYLDQYENCACVGTPCDVPDCSNGVNYEPNEFCNNEYFDTWLSCQVATNPNPIRPDGHWVMFDLHEVQKIHDTHIWNYNLENQTGKGFKDVVIDYSIDGSTWEVWNVYQWAEASGTSDYAGFVGPDFEATPARYILVSALSNWNNEICSGFSEWQMSIEPCPEIGTPCDDGDASTVNDAYNDACECMGEANPLAINILAFDAQWQNKKVAVHWQVTNEANGTYYEVHRSLDGQEYEAIALVHGKAQNPDKTTYQLLDTKGAALATDLYYRLKMIEADGQEEYSHVVHLSHGKGKEMKINNIHPNPFEQQTTIEFSVPTDMVIQLRVFDMQGRLVRQLANERVTAGTYQVLWDAKDRGGKVVESGIYYVQLSNGEQRIAKKILKQ